jgi:predicted TIM-barrel fold metal-dependent hydrolase
MKTQMTNRPRGQAYDHGANGNREFSRRQFLASSGLAVAGLVAVADAEETSLPIIDCHTHIYGEDEVAYPPIEKPYRPPAGTGYFTKLKQQMQAAGVRSAVDIQILTFYEFDNRYTTDVCRNNRDVLTGVCFLNPNDPQSPALLEKYVKESNIRGLRFVDNRQSGLLDEPGNNALLATCERLGITACALTGHSDRPQLESLAARYPKLNLVIDHCLGLSAGEKYRETLDAMLALSKVPNIFAKLSYLATGSAEQYPFRDMHDSCRQLIKAYGPERCIWGSDFPCELWSPKATYSQTVRLFTHELGLDEATKRQILCETPRRLGFGVS